MEKNERLELAELLFPNITKTREEYEAMYPERNLPEGAMVTRFGPSPTGFVHMGSLFGSFIDSIYAKQSNGVFFLRIPRFFFTNPRKKGIMNTYVENYQGKTQ